MKYQPPFDPSMLDAVDGIHNPDPDAPYVNGDPRTGQEGSIPPFESVEHPMRELVHLIEEAGLTPSHEDLEQVRKAVNWMIDYLVEFGDSGDGIGLYHGNDDGVYYMRTLVAGDNVVLTLLTNPETGRTSIRIDAAGGGGGGGTGEANTGSNLGAGAKVFKQKSGVDFEHRTLVEGAGITITENANDIVIAAAAPAPPSLALVAPTMMLEQRRGNGVTPRANAIGVWTRRGVSHVVANQIAGAALASEQITLPAGTYRASFCGVTGGAGHHRTRLYDVTNALARGMGNSADSYTGSNSPTNPSYGIGRFTLAAAAVLELQTFAAGAHAGRQGDSEDNDIGADSHVDGWIEIIKEA